MTIETRIAAATKRLLGAEWPDGVSAEPATGGIALSGKALRHRFATEPHLRAAVQTGGRR